jgi:hypothetical protein
MQQGHDFVNIPDVTNSGQPGNIDKCFDEKSSPEEEAVKIAWLPPVAHR